MVIKVEETAKPAQNQPKSSSKPAQISNYVEKKQLTARLINNDFGVGYEEGLQFNSSFKVQQNQFVWVWVVSGLN